MSIISDDDNIVILFFQDDNTQPERIFGFNTWIPHPTLDAIENPLLMWFRDGGGILVNTNDYGSTAGNNAFDGGYNRPGTDGARAWRPDFYDFQQVNLGAAGLHGGGVPEYNIPIFDNADASPLGVIDPEFVRAITGLSNRDTNLDSTKIALDISPVVSRPKLFLPWDGATTIGVNLSREGVIS